MNTRKDIIIETIVCVAWALILALVTFACMMGEGDKGLIDLF